MDDSVDEPAHRWEAGYVPARTRGKASASTQKPIPLFDKSGGRAYIAEGR